jgi:hypothetical protein
MIEQESSDVVIHATAAVETKSSPDGISSRIFCGAWEVLGGEVTLGDHSGCQGCWSGGYENGELLRQRQKVFELYGRFLVAGRD